MTITDVVGLLAITALLISFGVRLSPAGGRTRGSLLVIQVAVACFLMLSLSGVYPSVDAALGGKNFLNLLTHLVLAVAYWGFVRIVATPLIASEPRTPWTLRWPVLAASLVGTAAAFARLGLHGSSRGMDDLMQSPAWIAYWVFSLLCLWLPAFQLIPRLKRALGSYRFQPLRVIYGLMLFGFTTSIISSVLYAVTYASTSAIIPREVFVAFTEISFITALAISPLTSAQQRSEDPAEDQAQH